MGVQDLTGLVSDEQGNSHVSGTALLEMSLEQQTLNLAAFGLLLRLNLMKGK
jgi:hypothetical protein